MSRVAYAHTLEGFPPDQWQLLEEHLEEVGRRAGEFAEAFDSRVWGELAGSWHDLGKYAWDFQNYLIKSCADVSVDDSRPGRVDHSSAGAIHAYRKGANLTASLAALTMVIAGHHGGLANKKDFESKRLKNPDKARRYQAAIDVRPPPSILERELPALPSFLQSSGLGSDAMSLRYELWTRMLFSSLIDADRLDTEAFENERKSAVRSRLRGDEVRLVALRGRLEAKVDAIAASRRAAMDRLPEPSRIAARRVLELRAMVREDCRLSSGGQTGRYSLTVPTGGGKTLAAMAFALEHALVNKLRRVIVVVPFTSIIDQTVKTYREAFRGLSRSSVVEHHSNLDPSTETVGNRLASENWDAPVIVTTSVQFFESLFSDRPSSCRKLHNIARSVVVCDEVQSLPHELRSPIFDGLNQLVDHYGCSLLLCTATQPALELNSIGRKGFPNLVSVREVIRDPSAAFRSVADRVKVEFRDPEAAVSWDALAEEMKKLKQVLAIVHRRADARELCQLMPSDTIHLSALMCPAHRRQTLDRIKRSLDEKQKEECRVVSTTLVEAGVDIDFPVVYRAYGGVDALAQAAGRCNREGKLADGHGRPIPGRLVLFRAPSDPPLGLMRGREITSLLLKRHGGSLDLFSHETYQEYFHELLSATDPDVHKVTPYRRDRDFPEIAKRFRMIDDECQISVVAPFGEARDRIEDYRRRPRRRTLRALQPFIINIPIHARATLKGCLEVIHDQVYWIDSDHQYDPRYGLMIDDVVRPPPEDYIF